jgi:hypothetical protein
LRSGEVFQFHHVFQAEDRASKSFEGFGQLGELRGFAPGFVGMMLGGQAVEGVANGLL